MGSKGRKPYEQEKFQRIARMICSDNHRNANGWSCKYSTHRVQYNLFALKLTPGKTTDDIERACRSSRNRALQSPQPSSVSGKKTNWFLHRSFAHGTAPAHSSPLLLTLSAESPTTSTSSSKQMGHRKRRRSAAGKPKTTESVLAVLVLRLGTAFLRPSARCVLFSSGPACLALFLHRS